MVESLKADRILDARGELCPMPVIKAKLALDELKSGQTLKVLATDPGSLADFQGWTASTGHKLLKATQDKGEFTYILQKN